MNCRRLKDTVGSSWAGIIQPPAEGVGLGRRVRHRLFEALGWPVQAVRPRRLIPADLLHVAGELDHVAVGIMKLQAHVAAGPAAPLEHELDSVLSEKLACLE